MRNLRVKKESISDEEEEVIENKLRPGMLREDLKRCLGARRFGHRVISPGMLLLQLQYGAIEGETVIDAVMQFDDDAINAALVTLTEIGLS